MPEGSAWWERFVKEVTLLLSREKKREGVMGGESNELTGEKMW